MTTLIQTFARRKFAFWINASVMSLTIWGLNGFSSSNAFTLITSVISIKFGIVQFYAWKKILAVFLFGPVPLFLSYFLFSASPGQLLAGIQEIDGPTRRTSSPFQGLVLSYLFLPSIVLGGFLPFLWALFDDEQRNALQRLAGTRSRRKGRLLSHEPRTPMPVRAGIFGFLTLLYFASSVTWTHYILFRSTSKPKGLLIGGTSETREEFYKLMMQTTYNTTPEIAFEAIRKAIQNKDRKAMLLQYDPASQIFFKFLMEHAPEILDEEIPDDMIFSRMEGNPNSDQVTIYFHKIVKGKRKNKEDAYIMVNMKDIYGWRTSLLQQLQDIQKEMKAKGADKELEKLGIPFPVIQLK